MRVKAVDVVKLINLAVGNSLDLYSGYMSTGAFEALALGANDVESDLNHTIKMLAAWAFRTDTKLLFVNGNSPYHHMFINRAALEDIANTSSFCVVDPEYRDGYSKHNITLPTTAQLIHIHSKLMKTDEYANIFPVDLKLDFPTTVIQLNKVSITPIKYLKLDEVFPNLNTMSNIVVNPYEFYNSNCTGPHISVDWNDEMNAFIKTQAELVLSSVFN